jgi:hypothetical protein
MSVKNILLSASLISPSVEKMKNHLLLEGDLVPVFDPNSLKGKGPPPPDKHHPDEHIIKKSSHINRLKDSHLYMYKNEPIYYSNPTPVYEQEYANQDEEKVYADEGNAVYEQNTYQEEENPSNNVQYTLQNNYKKGEEKRGSNEEETDNKRREYKKRKHEKKGKKKHHLKLAQESVEKKEQLKNPIQAEVKAAQSAKVQVAEIKAPAAGKAVIAKEPTNVEVNNLKKLTPDEIANLLKLISNLNTPTTQVSINELKLNGEAKTEVKTPAVVRSEPALKLEVVKQPEAFPVAEPVKQAVKATELANNNLAKA